MIVLGISGGPHGDGEDPIHFPQLYGYWHDEAAVLVDAGEVRVTHEEERLTRLKRTTSLPGHAIRACLAEASLRLEDLDAIAVHFTEQYWQRFLDDRMLNDPEMPGTLEPPSGLRRVGGEPILLNTSLNIGGEPIVDSVEDLVVWLLTTGVNVAVADHFLIEITNANLADLADAHAPRRLVLEPARSGGERQWLVEGAHHGATRSALPVASRICFAGLMARTPSWT